MITGSDVQSIELLAYTIHYLSVFLAVKPV